MTPPAAAPTIDPLAAVPEWIGGVPGIMVHHIHILVDDVEPLQQVYAKGVPGVDSFELHDVRKFNGALALMVRSKPVSIEYIQVTDPEIGQARLLKDEPLGFHSPDFLVPNGEAAIAAAKANGWIVTGRMSIYGCEEIWPRHPELKLNIEFMVPPPPGYTPGYDAERDKARVHIYGLDGNEDLYFE